MSSPMFWIAFLSTFLAVYVLARGFLALPPVRMRRVSRGETAPHVDAKAKAALRRAA